ncbi:MAG: ATP-binding protein [Nitrospiria bacterium]
MVKIAEIVSQNPWWNQGIEFIRYDVHLTKAKPLFFKREDLHLERGNIYVLRGPRQVGKTTYLKETIRQMLERGVPAAHILYLSFDFFTSRRELRNAINFFLDSTREVEVIYLFFDEITSLDDWNFELKYLADQGIAAKAVIVATGSNAVRLKQKAELLPGRGLEGNEFYIKPFSFREFLLQTIDRVCSYVARGEFHNALHNLKPALHENKLDLSANPDELQRMVFNLMPYKKELQYLFRIYLMTGGNPGVINNYLVNRYEKGTERIDDTLAEVFIRDVLGDLSRVQKQETLARQLLKALLDRYGSRYSFTKLSKVIERTHVTTIDYLELLEESFILAVFYAYDFNKKDIKSKGDKKVYFLDPFTYHSMKSYLSGRPLWDVITETLWREEVQSTVIEGIVQLHLLMHREIPYLRKGQTFLWLYYDKTGKEIDAILSLNHDYIGIEVKYQAQVNDKDVRKIAPVKNYLILSKEDVGTGKQVEIVPVDLFLSLLETSERNL